MIVLNTIKIHVQEPVLTKLHLNSTWAKYNLSTGTSFHQNELKFNFIKIIVLNAMQIIPGSSSLNKKTMRRKFNKVTLKLKKLVKLFGPRLLLWTCVLCLCQGQAFQQNKG